MFDAFLQITGTIGFVLWVPSIIRFLLSFYFMRLAGIKDFWGRGNFSIDEMKIINDFIFFKRPQFFQLSLKFRKNSDGYHLGGCRYPTPKERNAIRSLVRRGLLVSFHSSGILSGSSMSDPLDERVSEEVANLASVQITDEFRKIFHIWIPSEVY